MFIAIKAVQPRIDFIFVQDQTVTEFPACLFKQHPLVNQPFFPLRRRFVRTRLINPTA